MKSSPAVQAGVLPALTLGLLITASLAGPLFLKHSPFQTDFAHCFERPNRQYWLGTDELGRDILSRILQGARSSLLIATAVQTASTLLGVLVGLSAAYSNRAIDAAFTGLIDTLYGFPTLVIVLVIVSVLPPGAFSIILALTFVGWALPAAMMRRKATALLQEDFVVASYAIGASRIRTLFRHVLPNAIGPILILFTQGIATAIAGESALSYLGLGLPASSPTWGAMIAKGRDYLLGSPHLALFPAVALTLTVLAFNRLGDSLRIYLDPRFASRLK